MAERCQRNSPDPGTELKPIEGREHEWTDMEDDPQRWTEDAPSVDQRQLSNPEE